MSPPWAIASHLPVLLPHPIYPKPARKGLLPGALALNRFKCPSSRGLAAAAASSRDSIAAVSLSEDEGSYVPAVRSYEGDFARLSVVGAASREQALVAAAADGGVAAKEHLDNAGDEAPMVVETVFPGSSDEHSTVSTRLVLQAKEVKAKARRIRNAMAADIFAESTPVPRSILATTFRQVVIEQLWSFTLSIFAPWAERDMESLLEHREVVVDFCASSSDERFLSALAEAVSSCVVEETRREQKSVGLFGWLHKTHKSFSLDSSVCLYKISDSHIVRSALSQLETSNLGKFPVESRKRKNNWWPQPYYKKLGKIGGQELVTWTNQYIPAYILQIDCNSFGDVKLEGGEEIAKNRWEVPLTHFQTAELGNILDMYFEDRYLMFNKSLSHCLIPASSKPTKNNRSAQWLFYILCAGIFGVLLGLVAQACRPSFLKWGTLNESSNLLCSESPCFSCQSSDIIEIEVYCKSVIEEIKSGLMWPDVVMFDPSIGAWVGKLPKSLTSINFERHGSCDEKEGDNSWNQEEQNSVVTSTGSPTQASIDPQKKIEDIACFQVVLSEYRKVVGFQPTNRVAVNNWAGNPLASILHGGRKLSPGLLEPSIRIPRPYKVVPIELLMSVSVSSESAFALARPLKELGQ